MTERLCGRCDERPRRVGQRWCLECHSAYARQHRVLAQEIDRERREAGERSYGEHCGVYFCACAGFIKIGLAIDYKGRMRTIKSSNPLPVTLLGFIRTDVYDAALLLEQRLHAMFEAEREHGEWFRDTGSIRAYIAASPVAVAFT